MLSSPDLSQSSFDLGALGGELPQTERMCRGGSSASFWSLAFVLASSIERLLPASSDGGCKAPLRKFLKSQKHYRPNKRRREQGTQIVWTEWETVPWGFTARLMSES